MHQSATSQTGRVRRRHRTYWPCPLFHCVLAAFLLVLHVSRAAAIDVQDNERKKKDGDESDAILPRVGELPKFDARTNTLVGAVTLPPKGTASGGGDVKRQQGRGRGNRRGILYHYSPILPPYYNSDNVMEKLALAKSTSATEKESRETNGESTEKMEGGATKNNVGASERDKTIEGGNDNAREMAEKDSTDDAEESSVVDHGSTAAGNNEAKQIEAAASTRGASGSDENEEESGEDDTDDAVSDETVVDYGAEDTSAVIDDKENRAASDESDERDDATVIDIDVVDMEQGSDSGAVDMNQGRNQLHPDKEVPPDATSANSIETGAIEEVTEIEKESGELLDESSVGEGTPAAARQKDGNDSDIKEINNANASSTDDEDTDAGGHGGGRDATTPNGNTASETIEERSADASGSDDERDSSDQQEARGRVPFADAAIEEGGSTDNRRFAEEKGLPSNLDADLPPADAPGYVKNETERGPVIDGGEGDDGMMPPKGDLKEERRRYMNALGDASIDARGFVRNETSVVRDTGIISDSTLKDDGGASAAVRYNEDGNLKEESESLDSAEQHKAWRGIYARELDRDGTQSPIAEARAEAKDQSDTDTNEQKIDVLDNIKEYVASGGINEGEILRGSIIKKPEEGDADLETITDLDPNQPIANSATGAADVHYHELMKNTSSVAADSDLMAKERDIELESDEILSDETAVPDTSDHQPVETYDEKTDAADADELAKPAIPDTPTRTNANSDFIDGIDDLHKFVEEVDPPDELDVAHGTSMQEVLVGKSVQILTKKITTAVRHIRSVASKVKGRVANSKLAGKIREGIESSGVIGFGEKVREKISVPEERASKAANRTESAKGVGKKIKGVINSQIEAVQHFFGKVKEIGMIAQARDLFGRMKANKIVASIARALGLNDEEDGDGEDMMDFASFQQMQGSIGNSDAAASDGGSLEERLAVLRAQANA